MWNRAALMEGNRRLHRSGWYATPYDENPRGARRQAPARCGFHEGGRRVLRRGLALAASLASSREHLRDGISHADTAGRAGLGGLLAVAVWDGGYSCCQRHRFRFYTADSVTRKPSNDVKSLIDRITWSRPHDVLPGCGSSCARHG